MNTKMKTNLKDNILASSQLHHHVPGLPVHVPSLAKMSMIMMVMMIMSMAIMIVINGDGGRENYGEEGNTDDDDGEYLMLRALSQPRPPYCVSDLIHAFIRNLGVKTMMMMIRRNRRRRKMR